MAITEIRLLPMNKKENDFNTIENVVKFLTKIVPNRDGKFYFKKSRIKTDDGNIVLFQYDGVAIGSATIAETIFFEEEDESGNLGYYRFETQSIKIFNEPIHKDEISRVDTTFKGFNQAPQSVSLDLLSLINTREERKETSTEYSIIWGPFKNDDEVITFASAGTYDLVMHTGVHAHPVKKGFPNKICPYMVLRNTGGVMEKLFTVDGYVEINPYDIDLLVGKMDDRIFSRLKKYVDNRKANFGFKNAANYPYRFYFLDEYKTLELPKIMNPNPQNQTYHSLSYFGLNVEPHTKGVLFCNVAYMKHYDVDTLNDKPVNGGEYVRKTGDALEKYNFHIEDDGNFYGFVETKYYDGYKEAHKPKALHIEKINSSSKDEEYIDGVTVVFCAKSNIKNKTIIVGWYNNARVYRNRRDEVGHQYNIKAKCEDCFLVPEWNRDFEIPRAKESENGIGFGQSNVWFANNTEKDKDFVGQVMDYIANYTQEVVLNAEDIIQRQKVIEVLNGYFGTCYASWQKACWPNEQGNGRFRVWFPKLAEYKDGKYVAASHGCVNTISEDWSEFVFDDLKESESEENKVFDYDVNTIIFAKEPHGGPYTFRGVYVQDKEKSKPNHSVSKRISSCIKVIGSPASDIELLDEILLDVPLEYTEQEKQAKELSDSDLNKIAKKRSTNNPKKKVATTSEQYIRDPYIAEAARRRAKGICQLCHKYAPFNRADGSPYLESHHIIWLKDGGADSIENTVALCPNCHRKMHIVNDSKDVEKLQNNNAKSQAELLKGDLVGKQVNHNKYGLGKVLACEENDTITILFGKDERKFNLSACISKNTLIFI